MAFDGIRWAAGRSAIPELFGQPLANPLIGAREYRLTGGLHQALRADLDHPGSYNVSVSNGLSLATSEFLGNTGLTLNDQSWETFTVTFTTPLDVGSFSFLLFNPIGTTAGASYPGVDLLDLELVGTTGVPEPMSIALLGSALIGFGMITRRLTT